MQVLINRGMLYLDVRDYRNALVDFNQASEVCVCVCFEKNSAIFETNVSMHFCRSNLMIQHCGNPLRFVITSKLRVHALHVHQFSPIYQGYITRYTVHAGPFY